MSSQSSFSSTPRRLRGRSVHLVARGGDAGTSVRRTANSARSRSAKRVIESLGLAVFLLGSLPFGSRAQNPPTSAQVQHRSLAAYPNAIVSLRDSQTGMIFYVETNGRVLVGLTAKGRVAWRADVPAAAKLGAKAVIRSLRLDGDRLVVTCGKSDTFAVDVRTGAVRYEGSD